MHLEMLLSVCLHAVQKWKHVWKEERCSWSTTCNRSNSWSTLCASLLCLCMCVCVCVCHDETSHFAESMLLWSTQREVWIACPERKQGHASSVLIKKEWVKGTPKSRNLQVGKKCENGHKHMSKPCTSRSMHTHNSYSSWQDPSLNPTHHNASPKDGRRGRQRNAVIVGVSGQRIEKLYRLHVSIKGTRIRLLACNAI